MTALLPAAFLRHRRPALLLGPVVTHGDAHLLCRGVDAGRWPWPRLLEGSAQAAGFLAGLQANGPGAGAVIAEFRDVVIAATGHRGAVRFAARLERRLAQFWRCRCEARTARGTLLLAVRVTVARGGDGP